MARGVTIGLMAAALLGAPPVAVAQTGAASPDAIAAAIRAAFASVLPFPDANADGSPANGATEPLWTVRWPSGDERTVDVNANPLNIANQKRAAQAEVEIQSQVMRAQQRSQGDYERALAEFARGDKTSPIREVSLFDDGVAGERFDAETRLTIAVDVAPAALDYTVASSLEPVITTLAPAVVAVAIASNTYRDSASVDEPAPGRFAPAQARVFIGDVSAPAIRRQGGRDLFTVTVHLRDAAQAPPFVVTVSGNGDLVQEVLHRTDWSQLQGLPRD
jgi:hypothetical protein